LYANQQISTGGGPWIRRTRGGAAIVKRSGGTHLFRPLTQLSKMAYLSLFIGCTNGETVNVPPGNNGGDTSANVGGSIGSGGATGAATTVASLGGDSATGSAGNGQGGAKAATGGANAAGGAVAIGGGSAQSTAAAKAVGLTWAKGAGSNDSSEIDVLPLAGAAPILASRITLSYCGAGAGQIIQKTDLKFDQAALICPSNVSTGDCTYGSSVQFTPSITVTGTARDCCYEISLGTVAKSLVDGTGGMVKLVYRIDQNGVGINYTYESTWTVLVDGVASMHCTLGEWSAAANAKVTCS
jgi:hypothetical protein